MKERPKVAPSPAYEVPYAWECPRQPTTDISSQGPVLMQVKNLPTITARYWSAILAASMCGANPGDFLARNLQLGHIRGLLPLAVVFSIILWAERRAKLRTEAYYWLAVIVVRTAATNLADLATRDLRLGYGPVESWLTAL